MIERGIPSPRQPQRQASLHDVLAATAEQTAERAKNVVGSNEPKRVAGFLQELNAAKDALARKWGVDPQLIPVQQIREIKLVYQKPPIPAKSPEPEKLLINQREPSDEIKKSEVNQQTPQQPLPEVINPEAQIILDRLLRKAVVLLRRRKRLKRSDMARELGISVSMYEKMELGVRNIKPGILHDICNVLGIGETDIVRKILMQKAIDEERTRREQIQAKRLKADIVTF